MNITNRICNVGMSALLLAGCGAPVEADEAQFEESTEALSEDACPEGIPAEITPGANQSLKKKFNAVGVQIYVCTPTPSSSTPTWTFVAPQANLMKDDGELVGTHFIGATWQGNDESNVVASRIAGATVDPTAIPWLLLGTVRNGDAEGIFEDVTQIQRVSTVGGLAPTTGCDAATVGSIAQVPYSAEYIFYKTKTEGKLKQCKGS